MIYWMVHIGIQRLDQIGRRNGIVIVEWRKQHKMVRASEK